MPAPDPQQPNAELKPTGQSLSDWQEGTQFFKSITGENGPPHLPQAQTRVSDAAMKWLMSEHKLVESGPDDMNARVASNPLLSAKDEAGNKIPVYVLMARDRDAPDVPEVQRMQTSDGKPFILVNEAAINLSPRFVQEHLLSGNKEMEGPAYTKAETMLSFLKENPDNNGEKIAGVEKRFDSLAHFINDEMKGSGKEAPTVVFADISATAEAVTTKEGKNYLVIGTGANQTERFFSDEGLKGIMGEVGHELSHFKNGDTTAEGFVRNRPLASSRRAEALADLGGGASSHNPEAIAQVYYNDVILPGAAKYFKEHTDEKQPAGVLPEELQQKVSRWMVENKLLDPLHAAPWDTITALKDEAARMKEYESNPANDPKAEAESVIRKVMEDMKGKWQLPVADMDQNSRAKAELPQQEQLAQIARTWDHAMQQHLDQARAPDAAPHTQDNTRKIGF